MRRALTEQRANSGLPGSGMVVTTLPVFASNTVAERPRPLKV